MDKHVASPHVNSTHTTGRGILSRYVCPTIRQTRKTEYITYTTAGAQEGKGTGQEAEDQKGKMLSEPKAQACTAEDSRCEQERVNLFNAGDSLKSLKKERFI